MAKSAQEVYDEVLAYIASNKHKRPCTLATIKKELRTPEIVDLIFAHPDVFNLMTEIKYVLEELLTDKLLMKYVLSNANNFYELEEKYHSMPVLLAFEMSKRRYERNSSAIWGIWGEKLRYTEKAMENKKFLVDTCNEIEIKLKEKYFMCIIYAVIL